ncbi:MAG: ankyrin repeat domain-containing protein [Candidatus Avelusimicrobium sp.]|uniref:ankyrin repeat domain-containing protein n=1 Tax=Candidatus Avelusimicrobium sp. TaxID=3048833 RepID=UPI003F0D9708
MFSSKKPTTGKTNFQPEKKVPVKAVSALTKNPFIVLGVVAAVPVLIMLAFTFKSGYSPSGRKGTTEKIVVVRTPIEIADAATEALQKRDTEGFLDILNNEVGSNINMVNSKGDTLLLAAATFGNLEAVQQLILSGADVNKKNAFTKDTALLRSLYGDNSEITHLLVYSGADINAKNNYNHSPMFLALEKGKGEFIDLFLTSGVTEGLSTDYLFRACAKKNPVGVLAMLKGGIDPNVKNAKGNTPLIISASLGDLNSVRSLLAYRADVNAVNNDGNTPLIYAARYNHPEVLRELLKPQTLQAPIDVNAQNKLGQTALYWAASKGYDKVVRRLLAAGADSTLPANNGQLPYTVAQKNNRTKVLPLFEQSLAEIKNAVIEEDNAALIAQAKAEGRDISSLTEAPVEDVTDADIFKAAEKGDVDLARRVVEANKAVLWDKNASGDSPLLVAVENGHTEIVDFLFSNGARLFEASAKGNVFHIAVKTQNLDMLKHLVQLSRQDGRLAMMLEYKTVPPKESQIAGTLSPLGFAALNCNKEIYDYLISVGARPGVRRTTPNLLGFVSPAELMEKCKAKPAAAKTLKAPAQSTTQKKAAKKTTAKKR